VAGRLLSLDPDNSRAKPPSGAVAMPPDRKLSLILLVAVASGLNRWVDDSGDTFCA
jgi:hypothetical protein